MPKQDNADSNAGRDGGLPRDLGRVDVNESTLPGIGLRHEFRTARGRQLGVVTHRTGRRDLVLYSNDDPDAVDFVLVLDDREADTLAGLLGGARFSEHLDRALANVPGVVLERLPLPGSSPYAGGPLGATAARTRTGVYIVAIERDDSLLTAPGPDDELKRGDTLVVVGTPQGVAKLQDLLAR